MKKILIVSAILLFCAVSYASSLDIYKIFKFSEEGYEVSLISSEVAVGSRDSNIGMPSALDNEGNLYYCTSQDNPYGLIWIIKKVKESSGKVSEVCRLNVAYVKQGYIRNIYFTRSGDLYVWLSLKQFGRSAKRYTVSGWSEILVKISKK